MITITITKEEVWNPLLKEEVCVSKEMMSTIMEEVMVIAMEIKRVLRKRKTVMVMDMVLRSLSLEKVNLVMPRNQKRMLKWKNHQISM